MEQIELVGGPNDGELYALPDAGPNGIPRDVRVAYLNMDVAELRASDAAEPAALVPTKVALYRASVISDVTKRWRYLFHGWER